mmetsp:Transcript_15398/g.23208  ORF Transcript_15398/g.23208 Transcript_15398/m.23208 type:complete len:1273 (+) Transcript_15398:88-3906(+)|eukprot:CAMPEP_0185038526 /NCGR_PEP_ID=MMETSP1103-20130426/34279_1 /TAXON_ID=36769 /ORGANISM="Paraphysomonas bandaiensis, Strain Caron Lab Isolate" /LENGTH=1272 /DNA_ID=CAMNT_0027576995 /DNA_START=42 /DNA_END=3860 /DNA_ORIENTATION=-
MGFISFVLGIIIGLCISIAGTVFFLLGEDNNKDEKGIDKASNDVVKEREPTEDEVKLLENALKELRGDGVEVQPVDSHPAEEQAPLEAKEMETGFLNHSRDAKERQKHAKSLCNFLQEFSRVHSHFSKELKKMSTTAEMYVKAENGMILDKWWNSISIALDHLSNDQNSISTIIHEEIYHHMVRVEQEQGHLERQLQNEGSKLIQKLKDAQQNYDLKARDNDKIKDKVNAETSHTTADGTHVPASKSTTSRLHASETALTEVSGRLAAVQQEFNEKMPRILADYSLMTSNSVSSMMELLIQLSDLLAVAQEKSSQVTHRLKMDLASSAAKSVDRCNYNPVVRQLLERIAQNGEESQMDMKLESSAGLAASCLSSLPALPMRFQQCVGKETCVWFNALSGRMYRDAARSEWYNEWFCQKVANLLNKGKRSPLIDKYKVSGVKFGSTPPLLLNVQWAPTSPSGSLSGNLPPRDIEHDVECTADVAFRSGLSFTVHTRLWINWPREKCAFIPISIILEVSELCGRVRFGVRKHCSFLSFVEEPYTRFTVGSEVGDQYKLKNLPKLSSVVVNKIKKHIRTKMVYPNAFKFRLIWPRKWWPESPFGNENLFRSESTGAVNEGNSVGSKVATGDGAIGEDELSLAASAVETDSATTSLERTPAQSSVLSSLRSGKSREGNILHRWFTRTPVDTEGETESPAGTGISKNSPDTANAHTKAQSVYMDIVAESRDEYGEFEMAAAEDEGNMGHTSAAGGQASDITGFQSPSHRREAETTDDETLKFLTPGSEPVSGGKQQLPERPKSEGNLSAPKRRSIVDPDHVRMYVSALLTSVSANRNTDILLSRRAADDILVRDKHYASESIAIMRTRSHSIADFRHSTLETMWAEFLGSIGHDFSLLAQTHDTRHEADKGSQNNRQKLTTKFSLFRSRFIGRRSRSEGRSEPSSSDDEGFGGTTSSDQSYNFLGAPLSHDNKHPTTLSSFGRKIYNAQKTLHSGMTKSKRWNRGTKTGGDGTDFSDEENEGNVSAVGGLVDSKSGTLTAIPERVEEAHSSFATNITSSHSESSHRPVAGGREKAGYGNKFSMVVDALSSVRTGRRDKEPGHIIQSVGHSTGSSSSSSRGKYMASAVKSEPSVEQDDLELEQEVMNLAWQAQAQAITQAVQRGEHLSMQNFMRTPKMTSPKCWVVMRDGKLTIFPNTAHESSSAVEKGQPIAVYELAGCTCRPLEQPLGFEIGVVAGESRDAKKWIQFWTETDIQCRAWVMALQHSAVPPPCASEAN